MRRILTALSTFLTLMCLDPCAGSAVARAQTDADIVVTGRVVTMDPALPEAQAVAIRDGRIVYVGARDGAMALRGASTRLIDAGDGLVLPGLVDAHGHLRNLGRSLSTVRLTGTRSRAECAQAVRDAQKHTPPGRWIRGRGWDQNDWETQDFPNWRDLDGTEANPVYLRRVDGHAAWVNATALDLAGITRDTPDPPGGRIVRDEGGSPTGVLVDNATDLVSRIIPAAGEAELDGWMRSAVEQCSALGLTGVHDAGIDTSMHASLLRLAGRGQLPLRVYGMMSVEERDTTVEARIAAGPVTEADGLFTMRAIKLYADGALGSRGAALLEPYSDDPGNRGLMLTTEERIEELTRLALAHGFQVCVHAIGDRGNRVVLDVFQRVLQGRGGDHRFRIEHAQVLSMQDIARFHELGVIPSMQPTHCTSDMYWAEKRLGPERILGAYAWRALLDDGNIIPMGSDFPVESANPLWGIYAAVTRQDQEGWPEGGWYARQRVSLEEAVRGFTAWAAFAAFEEDRLGMLREGYIADVTVLDRDIFAGPPAALLETRAVHTIVAGRVAFGD